MAIALMKFDIPSHLIVQSNGFQLGLVRPTDSAAFNPSWPVCVCNVMYCVRSGFGIVKPYFNQRQSTVGKQICGGNKLYDSQCNVHKHKQ